jgi:Insertion element 4 transposase N-terminal/Transposase DDE domain
LSSESVTPAAPATVEVVRTVTVAGGVFAPGHLGELTQVIPFELVDAVLEETGMVQRRLRDLPSRVGVYFLLALGLFEHAGARLVWQKLVAALHGLAVAVPSEKALRDLRRRIGAAPLRALFQVLAVPLAQPSTPGVRYRRWRTVAFDGCGSLKVPDAQRNRGWLGKLKARFGLAGYPTLMLMTLVETGTRGLLGAAFGPSAAGERAYAMRLVHLLDKDVLLLTDRGFDGNDLLAAVVATGAQVLARCKSTRRPPVLGRLSDGSYLTRIAGLRLRVIEARVTVTGADGSQVTGVYRLVTTLLDHRADPAGTLIALYHERWEVESAYFALRHTLLKGRVLRSKDPAGIEQEMWALLLLYQAIRHVMVTAVETQPGTDPDRAGFTTAVEAARDTVITATGILPGRRYGKVDLVGRIGAAVLADLLPARRLRFSVRTVKCGISRYHTWKRHTDTRPLTSTPITAIEVTVHQPESPQPRQQPTPARQPPTSTTTRYPRRRPATSPTATDQARRKARIPKPSRWPAVQAILQQAPQHPQRARDIARNLGITGQSSLNSFCVQMSTWARCGWLTKTAPATYLITLTP